MRCYLVFSATFLFVAIVFLICSSYVTSMHAKMRCLQNIDVKIRVCRIPYVRCLSIDLSLGLLPSVSVYM